MLYKTAGEAFADIVVKLKDLQSSIIELEQYLEDNKVPYTPGRDIIIDWKME